MCNALCEPIYHIAGIFRGVKLRGKPRTFLPTKQYHIVPGCGLVYCDHENFPTNWPKIHCSQKFYPPKNTRYTVCTCTHIPSQDRDHHIHHIEHIACGGVSRGGSVQLTQQGVQVEPKQLLLQEGVRVSTGEGPHALPDGHNGRPAIRDGERGGCHTRWIRRGKWILSQMLKTCNRVLRVSNIYDIVPSEFGSTIQS